VESLTEFHDKLKQKEGEIIELKERMLMQEHEDMIIPPGD
jgi:hypothetical protein